VSVDDCCPTFRDRVLVFSKVEITKELRPQPHCCESPKSRLRYVSYLQNRTVKEQLPVSFTFGSFFFFNPRSGTSA
jgi:hypothetical protein